MPPKTNLMIHRRSMHLIGSKQGISQAFQTIDSEIASSIFSLIATRMARNPKESIPQAIDSVTKGFSTNTLRILVKALAIRVEALLKNKGKFK